jgi:hypothetical protein
MTADNARRQALKLICSGVLASTVGAGLYGATPAWGGKTTCLTGTDPVVGNDAAQITAVRAVVEGACPCVSYDGSSGKTHAKYTKCARLTITSEVGLGHLRKQCKGTMNKYYSKSTCGVVASKAVLPCVKKNAAGKVSCAIKPSTKCVTTTCDFRSCIDAADTNHDGIIDASDSGECAVYDFVDNGDGTIGGAQIGGLLWEKKDQAGGLHDMHARYTWSGLCGCDSGSCTGSEPLCQPSASAANACSATGAVRGCAECDSGTCNVDPLGVGAQTTIWDWLVQLNASNFAGHSDWRIPTVGEDGDTMQLETIFDGHGAIPPSCGSPPCVPAVFNTNCTPGCAVTGCSCTASSFYWSATTSAANPKAAWVVGFSLDDVLDDGKAVSNYARAVR